MKSGAFLALGCFFTLCFSSFANTEEAYLDPPYEDIIVPINDVDPHDKNQVPRSPIKEMLKFQSSVKSQGSRGTCSIFSAAAMLESHLIQFKGFENPDVSEEWIQFLSIAERNANSDGSWSFFNWSVVSRYGLVLEEVLPYIGEVWKSAGSGLPQKRCGGLQAGTLSSCLLAHWNPRYLKATIEELGDEKHELHNPEFAKVKTAALDFKSKHIEGFIEETFLSGWWGNSAYRVYTVSEARELLQNNIPITMSHHFYYGAYNHGKASSLGMQINADHWSKGIIGYPEYGSVDRAESRKKEVRAGHSVLIVGYDDEIEIVTNVLMEDGSTKEFKYKGAYIFKNSWGQHSFGKNFTYQGVSMPGYGIMPYKYVNDFGTFYKLSVIGEAF